MSNEILANSSLQDILGADFEDFEELSGFDVPPRGRYTLEGYWELVEVNDKPSMVLNCEVVECLEQVNSEEVPARVGTKFGVMFNLKNEFGLGALAGVAKPFMKNLELKNYQQLLTDVHKTAPVQFEATLKHRKDKSDPDKVYPVLKDIIIF